jgi:hypothetical protein
MKMEHAASRLLTRQGARDSTRLDPAGGYTLLHVAIMSKPNSHCRVFVSLIGPDSTVLLGRHPECGVGFS